MLSLQRCTIRPFRRGDEAALVRHADDREVWRNMRDRFPHPYTAADADAWLAFVLAQEPLTNYAIDVGGEATGSIGLELGHDVYRRSAEIGYWLGRAAWNRGVMTEAVRAFTEHAFARLDLCRIFAGVFSHNPASMRVLEKAGYEREAVLKKAVTKDGATLDQVVYAVVR